MGVIKFGVVVAVLAACGTEKINQCDMDADCTDIAFPFCDVSGQYSAGETHVCTVTPSDCPIERCGCTAGATTCTVDQLQVCNADGMSASTRTCDLGCADKTRCLEFDPGFGLDVALQTAASDPAITLTAGSVIDSDTGVVQDSAHLVVAVPHQIVGQTAGPDIQVFTASSFQIGNVTISGSKAVAFVSTGPIAVTGSLSIRANQSTAAPGAQENGTCVGFYDSTGTIGGGGGNATDGGYGNGAVSGHDGAAPGSAQGALVTLIGGCRGGSASSGGGGGGGGIILVSLPNISVTGVIDAAGGGGGGNSSGGGSGGNIVLESKSVSVTGSITANGGGGGACGVAGSDGRSTAVAAPGGGPCGNGAVLGGSGGTATSLPNAMIAHSLSQYAGGGGAVGRLLVRSADGTFTTGTSTVISAIQSTAMIQVH